MPLLIVFFGIVLLLILMAGLKLNAFIALIIVSIAVGLVEGMAVADVVKSVESGIGSTLGSLVMILGFGAMLGRLIADSGAALRITQGLIEKFGRKHIQWAVVLTGFVVGLPMFYNAGFVILIPLVFTIAATTQLPLLYVGIPMASALSVTHGFLPPHPGPSSIAIMYKADMGRTLLYGIIIAIPTILVAGPLFSRLLVRTNIRPTPNPLFVSKPISDQLPGYGISIFTALMPVILMAAAALISLSLPATHPVRTVFDFIGNPSIALLISVLIAILTLGINQGRKMPEIMQTLSDSIGSIAMILLIISGGGALKQVLVDSGVGKYIAALANGMALSPLVMAWGVAALLRVALGSATVAALTTVGIVLPVLAGSTTSPELMVLATGAGSLMFSHVNDPGFWLFKEYFNLSISETMASWSIMETIVSVMGLVGVLLLNAYLV